MRKVFLIFFLVSFLQGLMIYSVTPVSGFPGVAVSPNGKMVAVAGISRTIYLVDAVTMEVTDRIYAGTQVLNLAFSNSGKVLISENRDETLNFFYLNGELIVKYKAASLMTISRVRKEVLIFSRESGRYSINFHSMDTGTLLRSIPIGTRAQLVGLDSDFKRLIIISKGPKKVEKVIKSSAIPKELKGIKRDEFRFKNDGKTSLVTEYDPGTGEKMSEKTIYFSVSQNSKIAVFPGEVVIMTYGNTNAKISTSGEVTLFRTGKHFNYGIGISDDGNQIASGGLRRGVIMKSATGKLNPFSIPAIPGWPEYLKGFAFAKDGSFFAGTSAFRLIKFDNNGKLLKAIPVY